MGFVVDECRARDAARIVAAAVADFVPVASHLYRHDMNVRAVDVVVII